MISAINDPVKEGILGACLTGLMVLVFLRNWRSALIVVLNIPISIAAALFALADFRTFRLHIPVPELGSPLLNIGEPAFFTTDGLPGKTMELLGPSGKPS